MCDLIACLAIINKHKKNLLTVRISTSSEASYIALNGLYVHVLSLWQHLSR